MKSVNMKKDQQSLPNLNNKEKMNWEKKKATEPQIPAEQEQQPKIKP